MKFLRMVLGIAVCFCSLTTPIVRCSEIDVVGGEATANPPAAPDWVRGKLNAYQPVWGRRGGLVFGVHSDGGSKQTGAPRGLIGVGYPVLDGGEHDLINFIAIEPVVKGRRGFSELEVSRLDGVRGKRIWASGESGDVQPQMPVEPGKLTQPVPGVEQLAVVLRVERYDNGAHVYLVVNQRSDAPDEIQVTIHPEPDSAPMQYCILTATMGNKARTRLLWLRDEVIRSAQLYPDYREFGFTPHSAFPLERLLRTAGGDVLVAVTTDERNPAAVFPFPGTRRWYYGGAKVTQYWRKPKGTFGSELSAAVNARYTYWQSRQPIPGGIAFENFELREPFAEGQCFVFGITRRTPAELGFPTAKTSGEVGK